MRTLIGLALFLFLVTPAWAEVVLVDNGQPRAVIHVPARLLDDAAKNPEPAGIWSTLKAEDNRRRLRASVQDFAAVLERISGAKIDVVAGKPPAGSKRLPILIGELAAEVYGQPQKSFPYQQGFRLVVSSKGLGLSGESDLATSYALYTLLDQLGCRWFMPSPLGEALPSTKTIAVKEQDLSTGPGTIYRGVWYCDNDFARRNRCGGMLLSAGHNIEHAVSKELRAKHPDIRAIIGGKPHPHWLKWTHPRVADALVESCFKAVQQNPQLKTYSLSPDDGMTWDESDDAKYDAGDFDPAAGVISKTDRLMVLANRVAERVTAKYPDIKFGMLAYADYTRAPVREKVHPAVVPQIAPITFSRAHPITDDAEPNNKAYRHLIHGWAQKVEAVSFYFYAFNLAEVATPNPMITRWSIDIPYVYKQGKCRYWQPETMANFETCMHALYLGLRMAWDPTQEPRTIIDDLHARFYGQAAREMAGYWHHIDDIWVQTPEYSGCGFGHLRRFTPARLAKARQFLDAAAKAAANATERQRVELAALSFGQLDKFMEMRRALAEGNFTALPDQVKSYRDMMIELGAKFQPQFCFARMGWTGERTVNVRYFDAFYKATYDDASRIAAQFDILTKPPLRQWRYQVDKDKKGEAAGWMKPDLDEAAWKATDVALDTWSTLGLHGYMGSLWYRAKVRIPASAGKKVYLGIGATDGRVKVFVNGQHIPFVNAKGAKADSFTGYCQPASFDITAALKLNEDNQISLFCTREFLNELGTGGLLAAPVVYRER